MCEFVFVKHVSGRGCPCIEAARGEGAVEEADAWHTCAIQALEISGPFNCQFLVEDNGSIKVIETNLRASRSLPFCSKVIICGKAPSHLLKGSAQFQGYAVGVFIRFWVWTLWAWPPEFSVACRWSR
jgi:hypothetical protein